MNISRANYSFWNGSEMIDIAGTSRVFNLSADRSAGNIEYIPMSDTNTQAAFLNEADGGMNGANVIWYLPMADEQDGIATIPDYRTTSEQLDYRVPYIEYIQSGESVSGLRWRIVQC